MQDLQRAGGVRGKHGDVDPRRTGKVLPPVGEAKLLGVLHLRDVVNEVKLVGQDVEESNSLLAAHEDGKARGMARHTGGLFRHLSLEFAGPGDVIPNVHLAVSPDGDEDGLQDKGVG